MKYDSEFLITTYIKTSEVVEYQLFDMVNNNLRRLIINRMLNEEILLNWKIFRAIKLENTNLNKLNHYLIKYPHRGLMLSDETIESLRKNNLFKKFFGGVLKKCTNDSTEILKLKRFKKYGIYKKLNADLSKVVVKGHYIDDKKSGFWYFYKNDGTIIKKVRFLNDQKNGRTTRYHNNGNIKSIEQYRLGKKNGTFKYYDYNGNMIAKVIYKDGIEK